jgi:iron(III) transport system permease protein
MSHILKDTSIVKQKSSRDDVTMRVCMFIIGLFLIIAIVLPLYTMLSKSLENKAGNFIGISN